MIKNQKSPSNVVQWWKKKINKNCAYSHPNDSFLTSTILNLVIEDSERRLHPIIIFIMWTLSIPIFNIKWPKFQTFHYSWFNFFAKSYRHHSFVMFIDDANINLNQNCLKIANFLKIYCNWRYKFYKWYILSKLRSFWLS